MSNRRGPYSKTKGRRESIAAATLDLVIEKGHRLVTLAVVAQTVGLTEAQVMYHFPSREHLLVGALEEADLESLRVHLPDGKATIDALADPLPAIAAVVTESATRSHVLRLYFTLCGEASDPEHPAHTYVNHHRSAAREHYAELLRLLQAHGWAHPDVDPQQFARQFLALWEGLQAQWLIEPSFDLATEVTAGLKLAARHDAVVARDRMVALAQTL